MWEIEGGIGVRNKKRRPEIRGWTVMGRVGVIKDDITIN